MKNWYKRNKKWVYLIIGGSMLLDLLLVVIINPAGLLFIPLRTLIFIVFGIGLTYKAIKMFRATHE